MNRTNCMLFTATFILLGLCSREQTNLKFDNSTAYQPVFKGTSFAAVKGNTADNFTNSLPNVLTTPVVCYAKCAATIAVPTDEGTIVCDFWKDRLETERKIGTEVAGAWGPWSAWGGCKGIVKARFRTRNNTRTDVCRDLHICTYLPNVAWVGWIGTAEETHVHRGPYNVPQNLPEEEWDYDGCLGFSYGTTPGLGDAVATVTSGKELVVTYSGQKAAIVMGSPFTVNADQDLPSQIASVKYNMDGLDLATGQRMLMNDIGEHLLVAQIQTRSGGIVKFQIPFNVIKPVTVGEITQQAVNNGVREFNIKIVNNNDTHSSVAFVSTSMQGNTGYVAEIEGSKEYNLEPGASNMITVRLRPSAIRRINPAALEAPPSFDFIVSSRTANGLVIDKKTITAQTSMIASTGGILGNDGPLNVRTIQVKTLVGEVVDIKLPNNIRPGDRVSGTVLTKKTSSSTLEGAVIDVQNNKSNLKDKLFTFVVPTGLTIIPFLLKNAKGETVGRADIPVNTPVIPHTAGNITIPVEQIEMPPQHAPGSFAPMNYCQPGEPLTINGFFDGLASNTVVSINNIPCEVQTESLRGSSVNVPDNLPAGKASLTIQEGGVTQTTSIQVVTTTLSSNKAVVQKGTQATVTATIKGLENLDLDNNNFKFELTNGSPGVVEFRNANGTTLSRDINSSNTKNGTFSFTTDIVGTSTGTYTVGSNVSSTTAANCWKKYQDCIAQCEADEQKCYDACGNGNKGFGCYLACSAAARLCEAACFQAYLNCVRQELGY